MSYQCPVCGYAQMKRPPIDFYICPCCGVEFGNDDYDASHARLRSAWIDNGLRWFSRATLAPVNWNPIEQLRSLGERTVPSRAITQEHRDAVSNVYPPFDYNPRLIDISYGTA